MVKINIKGNGIWLLLFKVISDFFLLPHELPASSIHRISKARILVWVAISFFRKSFQPGDRTLASRIAGRFFTVLVIREAPTVSNNQFSSVAPLCLTLWDPMECSTPGFPFHHQFLELVQTHVHWISNAIQPSCPLSFPSPPALNPSQYQGLFKWVSSSHQVAKVREFQIQDQSFQWTPRTDLL